MLWLRQPGADAAESFPAEVRRGVVELRRDEFVEP